jgi:hypothetical protein
MWLLFYLFFKNVTFYISIFVKNFSHYKYVYHNLGNHVAKCSGYYVPLTLTFKKFHCCNTVYPSVLHNSQNKQRIFMETALTHWSSQETLSLLWSKDWIFIYCLDEACYSEGQSYTRLKFCTSQHPKILIHKYQQRYMKKRHVMSNEFWRNLNRKIFHT